MEFPSAAQTERWRLAGWLGCVPAAEWEACQVFCYQRDSRVCRFGSEDAAGPAGVTPAFRRANLKAT